jgi:outer membrane protein OmpA-like peptidoglycan-associated protein
LDAPDFAIAPLMLKAFRNLTVGIATAPFRFIGKLVGIDAQKLENIYFEAGKAELLPPEREILEALGGVLREKKDLILNISGAYEDMLDGMQMRKNKVYAEVLSRDAEETPDITQMHEDELDVVLKKFYEESFDEESYAREKERIAAKNLDEVTEKKALRTQITEALAKEQSLEQRELDELAQERGESILNYLRSKGVEAEQLRLLKTTKTERSSPQNAYIPSRLTLSVKK